jgi:hypothetical protein
VAAAWLGASAAGVGAQARGQRDVLPAAGVGAAWDCGAAACGGVRRAGAGAVSADGTPRDHPEVTDGLSALGLACAAGAVASGRAQAAYRAWLSHVRDCQGECRKGVDCPVAVVLRQELRGASDSAAGGGRER